MTWTKRKYILVKISNAILSVLSHWNTYTISTGSVTPDHSENVDNRSEKVLIQFIFSTQSFNELIITWLQILGKLRNFYPALYIIGFITTLEPPTQSWKSYLLATLTQKFGRGGCCHRICIFPLLNSPCIYTFFLSRSVFCFLCFLYPCGLLYASS